MSFSPKIIVTSRDNLQHKYLNILQAKEKRGSNIIGCFSSDDKELSKYWEEEYKILSLCFDDIDTIGNLPFYHDPKNRTLSFDLPPKFILFDDLLAKKCVDYISQTKNLLNWIIFCDVGASRSSAIGDFIVRVLSKAANNWFIHYEFLKDYGYKTNPNNLVLEKLNVYFQETVNEISKKIKQ